MSSSAWGAERIILIGSMAEGDIGPFSDIDLLVVMPLQARFLDRLKEAYGRIQPAVAMDIIDTVAGKRRPG